MGELHSIASRQLSQSLTNNNGRRKTRQTSPSGSSFSPASALNTYYDPVLQKAQVKEGRTAMNNNEYESATVVEIGPAHELILGVKDMMEEDNGTGPPDLFPAAFAKFEE